MVLHIGGLIESVGQTGVNPDIIYGSEKALDFINGNNALLSEYELVMLQNYTTYSATTEEGEAIQILYDFIYNKPQLLILFTGTNSMISQPVCEVASFYNLVQVSPVASAIGYSDKGRYPLFLRTYPSDAILVPTWEAILRNFKWKRVAIIFENVEIFTLLMMELLEVLESRGGYDILTVEHVESGEEPDVQLESLKNHNARIIISLAYEETTRQIVCEAYKAKLYGRKYVWLLLGWLTKGWYIDRRTENAVTCNVEEMETALHGYIGIKVASYAEDFSEVEFNGMKPSIEDIEFYNYMKSNFYSAGFAYDTIIAIGMALNNSIQILSESGPPSHLFDHSYNNEAIATVLKDTVRGSKFFGVTGLVQFTEEGDRISNVVIEQMKGTLYIQVGLYDYANDVIIWDEENELHWEGNVPPTDGIQEIHLLALPSSTLRITMFTIAGAGIVFAVVCFVMNVAYRHKKVIKISSPFLNNFIILGCLQLYVLVILYGLDTTGMSSLQFSVYCHAEPLMLSIGLSLAFGALLMKTYRVYAIFRIAMEKFQQIRVGDLRLVCGVITMVGLDIAITVCWIVIDPMASNIGVLRTESFTDTNGHDFLYIYETRYCFSKYAVFWMIGMYAYKATLLLLGVFLAWEIRSVQIQALNESRQIALSVYVVALVSFISVPVEYFMDDDVTFVYAFIGGSVCLANTVVLGLAFVPKMVSLTKDPDTVKTSTLQSNPVSTQKASVEELEGVLKKRIEILTTLKKLYKATLARENHSVNDVIEQEKLWKTMDEGYALHLVHDFLYKKPQMIVLLLHASSMISKPVCELAKYYNLVQVSATASSVAFSNKEKYPLFIRTTPSDAALVTAWEALFRHFKWHRVAIIYENAEIFTLMMKELVSLLRSTGEYEILTVEHVESGDDPVVQMLSLKNHDARIIVLMGYETMSRKIMCQAYRSNHYGQKYVWMLVGWLLKDWIFQSLSDNDATCTDEEMLIVSHGYIAVEVTAYADDFSDIDFNGLKPKPKDIDVFERMRSSRELYYAGYCFDAVLAIALALNKTDKLISTSEDQRRISDFTYNDKSTAVILKDEILNQEFFGVSGMVRLTKTSDLFVNIVIQQKQVDGNDVKEMFNKNLKCVGFNHLMVEVGRFDVANDKFKWSEESPLIWQGKAPPTDGVEEIYISVSASETVHIVLNTMASVGILLSLLCLIMNNLYRNRKSREDAHEEVVKLTFRDLLTSTKAAKPLLLSLGLSLAFGAIFMKTYRVFAIFKIAVGKFKKIV
ncbi:gamma-aminobutyric acid type B receptor subunit 1-like [Glandiceps talaboti]